MTKQRVIPPFALSPKRTDDRQSSFGFGDLKNLRVAIQPNHLCGRMKFLYQ